ncbi:MAG: TIGR02594 family protein [Verrucomicrobiales bacterium]|nr:TIGR02594 family protein [Verrucomicrobiales bacterium]
MSLLVWFSAAVDWALCGALGFFKRVALGGGEGEITAMSSYVVQSGDTPSKIAAKFGLSMTAFMQLNPGLCWSPTQCQLIFPGQVLQVGEMVTAAAPLTPPWMQAAIGEIGVSEWPHGDNPRILAYLASVNIQGPDETSWCAAFTNWCLKMTGYPHRGSGRAADWFDWGRPVAPYYGCLVLLQPLAAGSSGHIGFLHALQGDRVWLLSGNSGNQVRIASYPQSKLIAGVPFRWPF